MNYNNIQDDKLHNFEKYTATDTFGLPYDYSSDMHYGVNAFNKADDLITLETVDPDYQKTIGGEIDLSFLDVKIINLAYCQSNYIILIMIYLYCIIFMIYFKPSVIKLWLAKEMDTLIQRHVIAAFVQLASLEHYVKNWKLHLVKIMLKFMNLILFILFYS